MSTETLIWFILLAPILAFLLISLFAHPSRKLSHSLALAGVSISWLLSMVVCFQAVQKENLAVEPFRVGDQLAAFSRWLAPDWRPGRSVIHGHPVFCRLDDSDDIYLQRGVP